MTGVDNPPRVAGSAWAMLPSLNATIIAILKERKRQELLKKQGKFAKTCADDLSASEKLTILAEEFGEVARAVCDNDRDNLREELVQCAAVCVGWLESLSPTAPDEASAL